jgi:hypothetical protein
MEGARYMGHGTREIIAIRAFDIIILAFGFSLYRAPYTVTHAFLAVHRTVIHQDDL